MSHPSPSATYSAMLTRAVSQCNLHCDQCAFRQAQRRRPRSLFVTYVSQVAHDTRGVWQGDALAGSCAKRWHEKPASNLAELSDCD